MPKLVALFVLILLPVQVVASPVYFPGNGHSYELVPVQTTWSGALAAASASTYSGVSGHLATVTSAAENAFLSATFASGQPQYFAWIGGYEPNDNGVWLWGAGPETGVQFSQGAVATPPYNYVNWHGIEPNDFASGEDFLAINLGGSFAGVNPGGWIDSPNPNPSDPIKAYIIEYETTLSGVGHTPEGSLRISPASPNPFDGSTRIGYSHSESGLVTVDIFDVAGRHVRQLVNRSESDGEHYVDWDGHDSAGDQMSTGVYLYVVRTGSARMSGKVLLIR